MKKLLVTLLLAAGLVTVASAVEPLDCANNITNQCCIDVYNIWNTIQQSPTHSITTNDNYEVVDVSITLYNDGTDVDNRCIDYGTYSQNGQRNVALFQWAPGDWQSTIAYYGNGSSAKKENIN